MKQIIISDFQVLTENMQYGNYVKRRHKMKKLLFGTLLLTLMFSFPPPTVAEVSVNIGFSLPLPPPIRFREPPRLVVLPDTYVYVTPDVNVDIFFNDGWWWRPYEGRWYRSRDYNSGWQHYKHEPSFYRHVPKHWRNDYKNHQWKGQQWNPARRDQHEVKKNWNRWKKDKHWEKNNNWGVQKARHNQNKGRKIQVEDKRKKTKPDQYDKNVKHDKNNKSSKSSKSNKNEKYENDGR